MKWIGLVVNIPDLKGSMLGEIFNSVANLKGLSIAPTLGVDFVQPWAITDPETMTEA